MRPVVEALRVFPIQVDSSEVGKAVSAHCPQCGDGVGYWYDELGIERREVLEMCVQWFREHNCYCDHIQSWGSRECILCGQSLL
jgi:hypothetical protein